VKHPDGPWERTYPPELPIGTEAWWIPISAEGEIRLATSGQDLVRGPVDRAPGHAVLIARRSGLPVLAWREPARADDDQSGADTMCTPLREAVGRFPERSAHLLGYAAQIVAFREEARFCPRCGTALVDGELWSRTCPSCRHALWPPATPAVLLLIHDGGDRILLAQKPGWGERWSILAGFVEPGESLEGCCAREALEEVGVEVRDPTYTGSQPWPFPHQLMIAFEARYVSGDVVPDPGELADARWFHVDALPKLPPHHALSRRAIEQWRSRRRP